MFCWIQPVRGLIKEWQRGKKMTTSAGGGAGAAATTAAVAEEAKDLDARIDTLLKKISRQDLIERKSFSGKSILYVVYDEGPAQLLSKVIEKIGDEDAARLMCDPRLLRSFKGLLVKSFENDLQEIPEAEGKLAIIFETFRRVLTSDELDEGLRIKINALIIHIIELAVVYYSNRGLMKLKPLECLAELFCSNDGRMFAAVNFPDPLTVSQVDEARYRSTFYCHVNMKYSGDFNLYEGLEQLRGEDLKRYQQISRVVFFIVPALALMIERPSAYHRFPSLVYDVLWNMTAPEKERLYTLFCNTDEKSLLTAIHRNCSESGESSSNDFEEIKHLLLCICMFPSDLRLAFFENLMRDFTYYPVTLVRGGGYKRSHYVFTVLYEVVSNALEGQPDDNFNKFFSRWCKEADINAVVCHLLSQARDISKRGVSSSELFDIRKECAFCALFSGPENLTAEDVYSLMRAMKIEDFMGMLEVLSDDDELRKRLIEGEYFKNEYHVIPSADERPRGYRHVTFLHIVLEGARSIEDAENVLIFIENELGEEEYRQVLQRTCQIDFSGEIGGLSSFDPSLTRSRFSEARWAALYNKMVVGKCLMGLTGSDSALEWSGEMIQRAIVRLEETLLDGLRRKERERIALLAEDDDVGGVADFSSSVVVEARSLGDGESSSTPDVLRERFFALLREVDSLIGSAATGIGSAATGGDADECYAERRVVEVGAGGVVPPPRLSEGGALAGRSSFFSRGAAALPAAIEVYDIRAPDPVAH